MLFCNDHAKCTHCHKGQSWADVKQVRAIASVAAVSWDPPALQMELNDHDIGPRLEEVETGQQLEWKDLADHSLKY
jgi:hypothetical protein